MNDAQIKLLNELEALADAEDVSIVRRIAGCLNELGYAPRRQKVRGFVLSFANSGVRQTIAKIGVRTGEKQGIFYAVKFYACKSPPEKFTKAVLDAAISSDGRYRCVGCGICGAAEGEQGYGVAMPDGSGFRQCGAYVVEIPALTDADASELCSLFREQHAYFIRRRAVAADNGTQDIKKSNSRTDQMVR